MSQLRILLIDSNERRASYLADALASSTLAKPVRRPDGESAVLWLGTSSCDLCIICYELPGMNGLETLARIRNRIADLPAIMFAETGDQNVAIAAFREGVVDFVPAHGDFGSVIAESSQRVTNHVVPSVDPSAHSTEDPTLAHIPRERLAPTYQNRLRAIGRQLDIYGFHTITVLEIEGGFLVRANRQRGRRPQALEFPDRDFPRLVASAINDDDDDPNRAFHQSELTPTGYEDLLRALGYRLDTISAKSIVITELEDRIITAGKGNDENSAVAGLVPISFFLKQEDVDFMLNEAFRRRGQTRPKASSAPPEQGGFRGILRRLN